jgi:hypothetical protein
MASINKIILYFLLALCCLFSFGGAVFSSLKPEPKPRFLIKFPTRARFEKFFNVLDLYYSKLSKEYPYHFLITCDMDDPVMNCAEARARFRHYPNLTACYGNSKSKVEACNGDMDKCPEFDILILASDDMIPVADGFDKIIAQYNQQHFPDYDGILHFSDGVHPGMNTLPIMGRKYYESFGYIYYPEYISLFCDQEMTHVSHMLGKSVFINQVLIEHHHPDFGMAERDQLYLDCYRWWSVDEALYLKRIAIDFGLKPEQIVRPWVD